jgi:hypothetical protein
MPDRPLIDIVRSVVAEVAPDELSDFDPVARTFAEAPPAARRGRSETSEASPGPGQSVPTLALAVAVAADLTDDAVLVGARTVRRRAAAAWARLRNRGRLDLEHLPPPVREVDAARLEAAAIVSARERGASDALAVAIGAALARQWPRRP